ncbi:hypothetical protein HY213_04540 [Candidatus Peregrinibacteria bacterium]|nr:hypothetical protein [Candidatus Peregrinibacteria bacterium]
MEPPNTPTPTPSQTLPLPLSWSAPIHPVHERSKRWYLIGGIVALACAAYGILTGTWSLTLVTLLIAAMYYLLRKSPPIIKQITIAEIGVTFDGAFIPWSGFDGFWFIQTPLFIEVHLHRTAAKQEMVIQTGEISVTDIRIALSQFLTERADRTERLVDRIIRICKL